MQPSLLLFRHNGQKNPSIVYNYAHLITFYSNQKPLLRHWIFQFLYINVLNYHYFHTGSSTFLKNKKNVRIINKKAVLSQRTPRNAPCPENFHDSLTTPTASIPNIFYGLLFRSTLWMFLQNLKCVALPVPEIIGGTPQNCTAPGYAHVPFSRKFLMDFYSHWPCKCTRQIWSP